MAEYIEREALLKSDNWQSLKSDFDKARAHIIILGQPASDVVEVVRCKDCKYFEIDEEDELGECKCGYKAISYGGALYPRRTDFCSYGERKCKDG